MRNAQKTLGTFSKSVTRFALRVGGIGTALGSLVAGGGLVALLRQASISADELAKTSDKLGTTTEGLAGMRYAAKLTGVQTSKLEMALQRMTRRVSEAAAGSGEAKDAIKELGLDAKALNTLSPDMMFREIAKAMQNVGSQGDKVRLAFKLFDSEGVDLVNTLALGNKELERLTAEAKKLGTGISRIDAAKVEMMNDSFTRLREAVSGVALQLLTKMTPYIEFATDAIFNFGTEGQGAAKRVSDAFARLARNLVPIAAAIDTFFSTMWLNIEKTMRDSLDRQATMVVGMVTALGPLGRPMMAMLGPLDEFLTDNKKMVAELAKTISEMEDDIAKKYEYIINKLGDAILSFEMRARQRAKYPSAYNPAAAGALGAAGGLSGTIQGRTRQEGFIGAGSILGVQKVTMQQKAAQQTAANTGKTAEAVTELLAAVRTYGFPISMGR